MKSAAVVLPVLLLAASCSVAAAETGSPTPMQIGDTWIYRVQRAGAAAPYRVQYRIGFKNNSGDYVPAAVSPPEEKGKTVVWNTFPPISPKLCMADLFMGGTLGLGVEDTCGTDLPVGRTWTTNEATATRSIRSEYKIAALEEVDVPAGRFKAYRIEGRKTFTETAPPGAAAPLEGNAITLAFASWYAPGTGVVKGTLRRTTGSGKVLEETDRELEQFTPAPR